MIGRSGALAAAAAAIGCAAGTPELSAPPGSVGLSESAALEELVRQSDGGAVAMVLPPLAADRPERVVLARFADAPPRAVIARLRDVERYPEFVDQVAGVVVRAEDEDELLFDAALVLPFDDLEYTLRYVFAADGRIDVVGEAGALEGGRWCWQAFPRGGGSLVVYTSEGDLGEGTGFVLRKLLDSHPDLQPGLAFAQGLRFLRSICDAAERAPGEDAP